MKSRKTGENMERCQRGCAVYPMVASFHCRGCDWEILLSKVGGSGGNIVSMLTFWFWGLCCGYTAGDCSCIEETLKYLEVMRRHICRGLSNVSWKSTNTSSRHNNYKYSLELGLWCWGVLIFFIGTLSNSPKIRRCNGKLKGCVEDSRSVL